MNAPRHSGGSLSIGDMPVTYAQMTELWDDLRFDFAVARNARDMMAMERIADQEIRVRKALHEAAQWRSAAGWKRPQDADGVRQ